MPSTFSIHRHRNETQPCDLPGCGRPRWGLNRWCRSCTGQANQYGHPKARPLRASQWTEERKLVRQLLDANPDHPGIHSVVDLISSWSATACSNELAFKGADEVARLARHGIKAADILVEVVAAWLWLQRQPHAVPDQRSQDFAMSRAVFGLAPRARRQTRGPGGVWPVTRKLSANCSYSPKAKTSAMAYVGQFLRMALAPFLANVMHSIEQQAEHQARFQAAMQAPLQVPFRDT
jgi:hypothetical protein